MPVKFKHMLPHEVPIWEAFVERYGAPGSKVIYDLHLGEGAPINSEWPEWMTRMVKALSRHRADVVIERRDEVVIIEVKPIAGMAAVGQLLGYEALWLKEHGTDRPVRLMCVCEQAEADMQTVFDFYEIELVEMGEV